MSVYKDVGLSNGGKLNEHMFDGGAWESYRDEIISKSSSHVWANNDFDNLMHALKSIGYKINACLHHAD